MGRLAVRNQNENNEESILNRYHKEIPHSLGDCDDKCSGCGAMHWRKERQHSKGSKLPIAFSMCCQGGKVVLPQTYFPHRDTPPFLHQLLTGQDDASIQFRKQIRGYNNALSFTSLGTRIDRTVDGPHGIRCFKISGQLCHRIGTLLPKPNDQPSFAQTYIFSSTLEDEASHRVAMSRQDLDPSIMKKFLDFLYEHNPYAIQFKSAYAILQENESVTITLQAISPPHQGAVSHDIRTYARPTPNEVAIVVAGGAAIGENSRDIILHSIDGRFQRVSELHTGYLPLRYPLLFLYGQAGWDRFYRVPHENNDGKTVSSLSWFAFLLFERPNQFSPILSSCMLFQEFCVDLYACVEHGRLTYIRTHQNELRADLYSGVVEALGRNDFNAGRPVILPSTYIGGPRHMSQIYHDAMAIVRKFGPPTLFITMTGNDHWPEIQSQLRYGQSPIDRPDILCRVFNLKFKAMMHDVCDLGRVGECVAHVHTIEHQQRGRPHGHFTPIMTPNDTPKTPQEVDLLVTAEIPDPLTEPLLYALVTKFMLHGPCKEGSSCWRKGRCRFNFPRDFAEHTTITDDSHPEYRRRDNGRTFVRGGYTFTNRDVVPYNKYLLLKYECHINVEVSASWHSMKYLYKYITKGSDHSLLSIGSGDEIEDHLDGRALTACESDWHLLQFPISSRYPAVVRLQLHEPFQQTIYWQTWIGLTNQVESGLAEQTTLTGFFELCKSDHHIKALNQSVRTLRYPDICEFFAWDKKDREWNERKNKSKTIGRVYFASITHGERYYLRLLLFHVRGPQSFEHLRTVNGQICPTFRDAAYAYGLILNDDHFVKTLSEGATFLSSHQLRVTFSIILKHGPASDPLGLWTQFCDDMSDDCMYAMKQLRPHSQPTTEMSTTLGLFRLSLILEDMGHKLSDYSLPSPDLTTLRGYEALLNGHLTTILTSDQSLKLFNDNMLLANEDQKNLISAVTGALSKNQHNVFFLDGPGGTGKTFTLNTLLHYCNSVDQKCLAVASSGIASLLLYGGTTAHTGLKIPVSVDPESTCNFSRRSNVGMRLQQCQFIVWDEISMQHKDAIHCVDRSLRDLRNDTRPFGGIIVLFAGDFRQTLPVIPRVPISVQAASSLKSSFLWPSIIQFSLHINVRLGQGTNIETPYQQLNSEFSKWLLKLGSGHLQKNDDEVIQLEHVKTIVIPPGDLYDWQSGSIFYSLVNGLIMTSDWTQLGNYYAERCMICPLNETVNKVNKQMTDTLISPNFTFLSIDASTDSVTCDPLTPELLNTFVIPNFPAHELVLCVGMPIILLRNLNLAEGLCNGTRLVVMKVLNNVLHCRIINGPRVGETTSIPRINLSHAGNSSCPVAFKRFQFPVAPAFCMTINKSQGQSLNHVYIILSSAVFSHGQLYVALSRCTNVENITVSLTRLDCVTETSNIVYKKILE